MRSSRMILRRRCSSPARRLLVQIKGLQQSLKAVRSQPGFAPARSTAAVCNMNQRLASLTGAHNRHTTTPSGIATLLAAPQPPSDISRPVGGNHGA